MTIVLATDAFSADDAAVRCLAAGFDVAAMDCFPTAALCMGIFVRP